ncbi:MAG: hypothetical protein HOW73_35905 [Polyangiaceae bacterium]|nr:hypothetical protein [Polyangiaceae bacterium]
MARSKAAPFPPFVEPQLATLVSTAPEGDMWLHEMKFDGYRILMRIEGDDVRLFTRRGNDWTGGMPSLAKAAAELPVEDAMFDGEVVALRSDGVSDFQLLQNTLSSRGESKLVYYVFDVLFADGEDLRALPLLERKARLAEILKDADKQRFRLSDHVVGEGPAFFGKACELGLEGIVSKLADRPYRSGRNKDWLKTKCTKRQEFVIGGFTRPEGTRSHFGALHLGARDEKSGDLVYVGKVGTGFSTKSLGELHRRLEPLVVDEAPFRDPPGGAEAARSTWVKPVLVAEIDFTERTKDGMLRHPTFKGLRDDKVSAEVVVERPADRGRKKKRRS